MVLEHRPNIIKFLQMIRGGRDCYPKFPRDSDIYVDLISKAQGTVLLSSYPAQWNKFADESIHCSWLKFLLVLSVK